MPWPCAFWPVTVCIADQPPTAVSLLMLAVLAPLLWKVPERSAGVSAFVTSTCGPPPAKRPQVCGFECWLGKPTLNCGRLTLTGKSGRVLPVDWTNPPKVKVPPDLLFCDVPGLGA